MVAFSLFNIPVYWYGIFYGISFLLAYFFLLYILKSCFFESIIPGLHRLLLTSLDDIFIYGVFGVFVGGRLGHILIYSFSHYLAHPFEIFMVWKGGMSFIGGIIGVVIAMLILMKKNKISALELFALGDLLFIPTAFGIMIGRVGNFLNQELYGIPVSASILSNFHSLCNFATTIGLFHVYPHVDQLLRINTNMLSSIFEGLLLLLFLLFLVYRNYKRRNRSPGLLVGVFFVRYSVVRFAFEYLRADSQLEFIGYFTRSQRFFLLFALCGFFFLIFRKHFLSIKQ